MNLPPAIRFRFSPSLLSAALGLALLAGASATSAQTQQHPAAAATGNAAEPWTQEQLLEPSELARILTGEKDKHPVVLDIGVDSWVRGGRVKGAVFIGPGSDPANLEKLRTTVSAYPKDTDLVIYCGCCPPKDCPNIRPAFTLLAGMKFERLRLLHIPKNLKIDWVNPGYPTEK
jgi:hypothetical protein